MVDVAWFLLGNRYHPLALKSINQSINYPRLLSLHLLLFSSRFPAIQISDSFSTPDRQVACVLDRCPSWTSVGEKHQSLFVRHLFLGPTLCLSPLDDSRKTITTVDDSIRYLASYLSSSSRSFSPGWLCIRLLTPLGCPGHIWRVQTLSSCISWLNC